MSRDPTVVFGMPQRSHQAEELTVYNSMVFNVSNKAENDLFQAVMRLYGPGQFESTIKPPETFFSSKDSAVYVFVEWMGKATYNEEFLGEDSPVEKDIKRFETEASQEAPPIPWAERNVVSLAERLAEVVETEPSNESDDGTPGS